MQIGLYATLRQIADTRQIKIIVYDGWTVRDALNELVDRCPQLKDSIWTLNGLLAGHVAVILNGRDIRHLDGVDTRISDEDSLQVFPPIGGGDAHPGRTQVTLKFGGELFTRMNGQTLQFEFKGSRLRELIPALAKEYDLHDLLMDGDIPKPYLQMMINGRLWYAVGGWDAVIESGSMVALFQFGGALKPVTIPAETTVAHLKSKEG
jgi:molybdopterin synthase sulfur carrier subunit